MNVLDILLLVASVWFAIVGYRQGFVIGVLSVLGFLGGGLVAITLLPLAWAEATNNAEVGTGVTVVGVILIIVCASVGQAFTTHLGNKLRGNMTWSPMRALDATGGALVNVLALLAVAWLLGSLLSRTTLPTVGREVRNSKVLLGVSRVIPADANSWFTDFSSVLAQNGFPQVFTPFANETIRDVPAPDPALIGSPVVATAKQSIVKVVGTAESCSKVLEGSGFVFSDHKVMTNAHVVGGVSDPTVQIGGEGKQYAAKVVVYDWPRDIAILDVPDLPARPLEFATADAVSGDSAIVAGFPENGSYDVRSARIRGRIQANGPDIYHRSTVRRDVYSVFSTVRQGNSGGPLLTPDGRVFGVVFAKSLDDAETGYALTVDEIQSDIEVGRTATIPVDTQGCAL